MTDLLPQVSMGLREIMGTDPSFFFHADQVPGANSAAVGALPCMGIPANPTQPAPPVINTTGWGGTKRALDFASNKYLAIDALAADYTSFDDSLVVVSALEMPNTAANRHWHDYGRNAAASWSQFYIDGATDYPNMYLDNGSAVNVAGAAAITMGAPIILVYARTSTSYSMFQLASGGETRFREDVASAKSGAVTFDRGAIGVDWNSTTIGAGFANHKVRAHGVWHRPSYNSAKLSALLTHISTRLDCPV